jgi:hypothetical protein
MTDRDPLEQLIGIVGMRKNGKQQDIRQFIEFAFGAPRIVDCCEEREEPFE